jgi:hypothetical protein
MKGGKMAKPDMMALALELRAQASGMDRSKARAYAHALHALGGAVLARAYDKLDRADDRFYQATSLIAENDL